MKTLSLLSIALFSVVGFASQKITSRDCTIYLPVTDSLTSWGNWQQDLIKLGYKPIEESDMSQIPTGALVGGLTYNLNANEGFAKKNTCAVTLKIQQIVSKSPLKVATLSYGRATQNVFHLFGSGSLSCKSAESKVKSTIPACIQR